MGLEEVEIERYNDDRCGVSDGYCKVRDALFERDFIYCRKFSSENQTIDFDHNNFDRAWIANEFDGLENGSLVLLSVSGVTIMNPKRNERIDYRLPRNDWRWHSLDQQLDGFNGERDIEWIEDVISSILYTQKPVRR